MKIRRIMALVAAAATMATISANAADTLVENGADAVSCATVQEEEEPEAEAPAAAPAASTRETPWYISLDYAGFEFEVPAGSIVEKGSNMLVKYPDGSFGVSMSNVEKRGANQKIAYEVCRRLATQMHLPNPVVQKVKYGKCGGAKASGELEGQKVTVLVLPYNDQEMTTVILASPDREDWMRHFEQTLKR